MKLAREEIDRRIAEHRASGAVVHASLYVLARMVMAGTSPIMVGASGCGKSRMGSDVAAMMDLPFHYARAVRDEFALVGYRDAHGRVVRTAFREAFEHGGVFLMDEMDAGDPRALLAFNEAFANGRCDFPDGVVRAHADFHVIAAANTFGTGRDRQYVGRNQLDATTLDRFAVMRVDYDRELERGLTTDDAWRRHVWFARDAVAALGVRHIVSTRAIVQGAELLAAGFDTSFADEAVLFRGLPDDQRERIEERMRELAEERAETELRERARREREERSRERMAAPEGEPELPDEDWRRERDAMEAEALEEAKRRGRESMNERVRTAAEQWKKIEWPDPEPTLRTRGVGRGSLQTARQLAGLGGKKRKSS